MTVQNELAPWPIRVLGILFLLALHVIFAVGFLLCAVDMGGNSSGARVGWLVLLVGIVLGFPWGFAGFAWEPFLIAAPFLNYALLWLLTIARVRRRLPVVTWSSALLAVAAAVALFAIAHFAIASLLPPNGSLRKSFLVFGAFMAPCRGPSRTSGSWVHLSAARAGGSLRGWHFPPWPHYSNLCGCCCTGRMGYDALVVMTVVVLALFFRPDRANDGVPAKTRPPWVMSNLDQSREEQDHRPYGLGHAIGQSRNAQRPCAAVLSFARNVYIAESVLLSAATPDRIRTCRN